MMNNIHSHHLIFSRSAQCGTVIIQSKGVTGDTSRTGDYPQVLRTRRGDIPRKRPGRPLAAILAILLTLGSISAVGGCTAWARATVPQRYLIVHAEVGVASWYGHPYHGRRAAGGQIYDMNKLTAAHRTLPFGTRIRVHNLENDAAVEVVINDRGPYIEGRLIDLSLAAARILKFEQAGLARVRLELLSAPIPLIAEQ
jgi:rare lipoprotein A (peptidoglycan hydrolase)